MKRLLHLLLPLLLLSALQQINAQDPAQYGHHFSKVPATKDINMYQVNIRAFSSAKNLPGVTARLDNIKDLGINVVYLMPVYPVGTDPKSANSPYCIKDFKSVAPEYGTLADLRNLVEMAHKKGMSVILDWVVNQTSWDNPWITQHPDWYVRDANGVIQQLDSYADVAALDMNNPNVQLAMDSAMRYWILAANVDGFRCDYADHPPVGFWKKTISDLRSIRNHKLVMLAEGSRRQFYGRLRHELRFSFLWRRAGAYREDQRYQNTNRDRYGICRSQFFTTDRPLYRQSRYQWQRNTS